MTKKMPKNLIDVHKDYFNLFDNRAGVEYIDIVFLNDNKGDLVEVAYCDDGIPQIEEFYLFDMLYFFNNNYDTEVFNRDTH